MSPDEPRLLQLSPSKRLAIELKAVAFAVTPLVSDFASTILFYSFLAFGGGVRVAVAFGIALGVAQFLYVLMRRQPLSAMQCTSLLLVVVVGGVTLITNDARIMFWKVSAIYFVVGLAMLQPGWMMRFVPPIAVPHIPREVMTRWGYAWAVLILCTGALNLALSLSEPARIVAIFMGVIAPITKFILFTVQYISLRKQTRRSIAAGFPGAL